MIGAVVDWFESLRIGFRAWRVEGSDKAWKPTGTVQKFSGYECHKAVAGYRKSRTQTPTGREYQPKAGNVVPMRKTR